MVVLPFCHKFWVSGRPVKDFFVSVWGQLFPPPDSETDTDISTMGVGSKSKSEQVEKIVHGTM